ncbi:MAG: polymer-forming cytoskeletal protein [Desulfobacterales bacterium]|jgi:cytoskeletal protein CcmA (bactofilin family)
MGKKSSSDSVTTFIGADARIEGTIEFDGTIRIDGMASGRICSKGGTLIIGEGAVVNADIQVDSAILMGEINGTIEATNRISASPPCRVSGDIQAPVVAIDPGVVFNGTCAMKSANITSLRSPESGQNREITEKK